jgi:DNA primase
MPGTTTEQIKEKLDVVHFLRDYVTLTPAGKNFKGLCPFHKEKSPSFMVSPDRQSWHCFGCGLGGDVFSFLMKHENIEFGEALKILAEKAGVELRRLNPAEYKFTGLLHEINTIAKNYFIEQLAKAPTAQKYLSERGLKQETVNEFELGWAPNEPEGLNLFLLKQKFSPEDIVRAGLAFKTERGMQLDRFRGRIMFPIHDHFGKTVGFTGRILPQFDTGDIGKYVNSPETPIFNKSKLLYGFNITKSHIRESGWVFLVEGQMDLLMSYQAGVKNVAASSGTALTGDHLRTLRRHTDQLMISFDSDSAGLEAAERAIDLGEATDFSVKVVRFEKYKDPAEAAQAGAEELRSAVKAAVPAPEFYFEKYLPKGSFDRRDRGYLVAVRAVLTKLKNIASAVQRDYWFKELARRLRIEERVLMEEAGRLEAKTASPAGLQKEGEPAAQEKRAISRQDMLSERLVSACMAKSDFTALGEHAEYLTPDYRTVLDLLSQGIRKSEDPRLDETLNFVALRSEELGEHEFGELKANLFNEHVKARRQDLIGQIKQAEAEGNNAALETAFHEFNRLPVL